jgi:hypothetical protein
MQNNFFLFPSKDHLAITNLLASDAQATKLDCNLLPKRINELLISKVDITKPPHRVELSDEVCDSLGNYVRTILNPDFKKIYDETVDSLRQSPVEVNKIFFTIDTIKINKLDLYQLAPDLMTSDNVVNAFAKMLCRKQFAKSVKVFPTELFTNMFISNGEKYIYENVNSWNKNENILDNDILLFPIFVQSGHWAVVVVYLKEREMFYLDSKNYSGGDKFLRCTLRYLYDESLKNCVPMTKLYDWKLFHKGINNKQQGANLNCGMYALMYIDTITNGFSVSFLNDDFAESYRYYVATCFIQSNLTRNVSLTVDLTTVSPSLDSVSDVPVGVDVVNDPDDRAVVDLSNDPVAPAVVDLKNGSDLLQCTKRVKIDAPDEITNHLKSKGVDPFEYSDRVSRENSLYVAKYYNSKPVFNAGGGLCFYLSTNQTLGQSGIRNRSDISHVSLKSALKLGMINNENIVRQMLSGCGAIPLDRDSKVKFKKWVNKTVDDWTMEHIIFIASYIWNIRFEIICDQNIVVYDPETPQSYPCLPIPQNFLKETVRIVYNGVDHYQAIEELSENAGDRKVAEMVKDMEIPAKAFRST